MSNQSELTEKQQEEVRKIASSLFDTFKTSIQTEIKNLTELLNDPGLKQYLRQNKPGRAYKSLYEQKLTKGTDTKGNRNSVQKDKKQVKPEAEASNKQEKKAVTGQPEVRKADLHSEKPAEDKKKFERKPLIKERAKYPLSPTHQKQKIFKEPRRNLSSAENTPGALNVAKKGVKDEKQGSQAESKKTHPPTTRKSPRLNKLQSANKPEEHKKEEGIRKEPGVVGKKSSKDIVEHKEQPKERKHSNAKEIDAEKKVNKKLPEHKEVPQSKEKVEEYINEKDNNKGVPKVNEQKQGTACRKSAKTLEHKDTTPKEGDVTKKQDHKEEVNEKVESSKKPIEHKKVEEKHDPQLEKDVKKVEKKPVVQKEAEKKGENKKEEVSKRKNLDKMKTVDVEHTKELKRELKEDDKKIHAPSKKTDKKELPKAQELKEEEREPEQQKKDTQHKEVKFNEPVSKEIPQHAEQPQTKKEEVKVKETKGQRRKRKRRNRKRRLSNNSKGVLKEPVKRTLSTNYVKPTIEPKEAS
jgi:hypothetical protein